MPLHRRLRRQAQWSLPCSQRMASRSAGSNPSRSAGVGNGPGGQDCALLVHHPSLDLRSADVDTQDHHPDHPRLNARDTPPAIHRQYSPVMRRDSRPSRNSAVRATSSASTIPPLSGCFLPQKSSQVRVLRPLAGRGAHHSRGDGVHADAVRRVIRGHRSRHGCTAPLAAAYACMAKWCGSGDSASTLPGVQDGPPDAIFIGRLLQHARRHGAAHPKQDAQVVRQGDLPTLVACIRVPDRRRTGVRSARPR